MTASSFEYLLRETVHSLRRNLLLSLASALTVFVSMVMLGFSFFIMANANNMANSFESQLEISVFLQLEITDAQIEAVRERIEDIPGIASVELVTKDQALVQFGQTMGENKNEIVANLGGVNPLPDKFTVKTADPQQVIVIAEQLKGLDGVGNVRYGQDLVEKLLNFTHWLRWIGMAIIALFTIASIVLISINIKLNVFSRRREIQIMKLVGASNAFIRWPFLIEGMLIGFVGGLLAALVVGSGYHWVVNQVTLTLAFLPVVRSAVFFAQVLSGLILGGMLIGAMGSAFSLRKFLKV